MKNRMTTEQKYYICPTNVKLMQLTKLGWGEIKKKFKCLIYNSYKSKDVI